MGRAAARKRTTVTKSDPTMDYLAGFDARSQLFAASLNLGWQLALTVLVPLFIGVQIDRRFDSSPSWTLTALFIAVAGSIVTITRTFKDLTRLQTGDDAVIKKRKRKTSKVKKNV
ncbi:MAG: AtpZ/AtpI family protein [bacterium]|nr:AtpZ/AtpI family protein [bacterium]